MDSFELFIIDSELYITFDDLIKLIGYKCTPSTLRVKSICYDGKLYATYTDYLQCLTKQYNRRNPEVYGRHMAMGWTDLDHAIEGKTLWSICEFLKSKQIAYEYQHSRDVLNKDGELAKRRIDLYLPEYKIGVECDENGHADRFKEDEQLRETQMLSAGIRMFHYNPDAKDFDMDETIKQLNKVIKERMLEMYMKTKDTQYLSELLKDLNENSIEAKYYDMFHTSLCGKGFIVDFDNVWKFIGYSDKGHAKTALKNKLVENIDFSFCEYSQKLGKEGRPSEKIMLTVEAFKMFCMMANTYTGRQVRLWYIKMEETYKDIIFGLASASVVSYDELVNNLEARITKMKAEAEAKKEAEKAAKKAAKKN
jgi:phage anti-repressor protein